MTAIYHLPATCRNYSFINKKYNGKNSNWFKILKFVAKHPDGVSKIEILHFLRPTYKFNSKVGYYDYEKKELIHNSRGYYSTCFSDMNFYNIITYNKHTRKWYVGTKGKELLK